MGKPFLIVSRNEWVGKYKLTKGGPFDRVTLGKHPGKIDPSRPPKKPPQFVLDRHNEFLEKQYRVQHGLEEGPQREKPLAEYVAAYLEKYPLDNKDGSVKQMTRHAENFVEFAKERRVITLQAVDRGLCRAYLESRARAGTGYGTMATERGYLSGVWGQALEDGLVAVNPWSKLKPPGRPPEKNWTFWSPEEVALIAKNTHKVWQTDLVLVMANTGLRISAALAMRWSWIDWKAGVIRVPQIDSKGGKPYQSPMTGTARDILSRRFAEGKHELVFPNPHGGDVVPYDSARSAIERAIKKAGVKPGTPHDLRHTYARWLVRQPGITLPDIQAALGHGSLAMTQTYLATTSEESAARIGELRMGE